MLRTSLLALAFFGLFLFPSFASIASAQNLASFAGCSGTDCSACNIVDLTNGLVQWLIGFLFVLFAIIIAYAGFGLVTSGGNSHAMDEAKGRFTNAIIGLIIVLAAWLVVDTIMRGLVGRPGAEGQIPGSGEVTGWLFWSEVQCYTQATTTARTYTPDIFEPTEMAIDDGTGRAGSITVSTPAGPQVVDIQPCDTSNIVSINFLGSSVQIHRQFAPSLQRIDARWRQMPNRYRVTSVGGYNCRNIAGTNRRSNHAYGLAVDINPAQNPHTFPGDRNYGATNMPPSFVQLFTSEGWGWGGNWNSSKDTMHFSKASSEGGNMRGN
jgi:hypothetical protein